MRTSPGRAATIVGMTFFRRGRGATKFLGLLTGTAVALALTSVVGVAGFLGEVAQHGQARDFGPYRPEGCIQASYRYDPVGLKQYTRLLLAAACSHTPAPPGLDSLPRPGETYLSPALLSLRESDSRILTRFPRVNGVIARSGLTGSTELLALVGVEPVSGPLPLGVTAFDTFGSDVDYLANYLRFSRVTFLVIGGFFVLLPSMYLVGVCTRLNARTRERQLAILLIMGVARSALRGALALEAVVTVGLGAIVGLLAARSVLHPLTPTFASWTAYPGSLEPRPASLPFVLLAVVLMTATAAFRASRVAAP